LFYLVSLSKTVVYMLKVEHQEHEQNFFAMCAAVKWQIVHTGRHLATQLWMW
jgi:hypothetical protein